MSENQKVEKRYDAQQVINYLDMLGNPVVEVRIFRKDRYLNGQYTGNIVAGYFDNQHFEKLSTDIQNYALDPNTEAIYTTIQQLDPDTLSRIENRLKTGLGSNELTSDNLVTGFSLFPVDVDPPRIKGISSTNDELGAAKEKARIIAEALEKAGIPNLRAMSGNGCHIDTLLEIFPNTEINAKRFKALGDRVAAHFNTDTTIYNPSRIFKLYGTYARKGDNTKERPHRLAWIDIKNPQRITFDELESKLNTILPPVAEGETDSVSAASPEKKEKQQTTTGRTRTLKEWLNDYSVQYTEKPYKDGAKYQMDCPFDPAHTSPDAACYESPNGWQFKCSHNSCSSYKWTEFKAKVAPQAPNGSYRSKDKANRKPRRENPIPEMKDASQYFIHDEFNVLAMSTHIQGQFTVWAQDSGNYIYDETTGVYRPGEKVVDAAIRSELGSLRKARHVDEIDKDLAAMCRRDEPDTSHLIPFKNGILDLRTSENSPDFSDHSPDNYLMSFFPIHFKTDFQETDGSKDFDAWLLDILDNDSGLQQLIYEIIGSILHKKSTAMQRGVLMVGEGGTGKSMLLEQIERMIGSENICSRSWGDYGVNEFAIGDLYNKSLSLDSDIDVNKALSGAIKPAITGNILTCNQKYKPAFNFKPHATWIGSINKFPRTKDRTWGFFRRWIAVPFNKSFTTNATFETEKRNLWSDPDTLSAIIYRSIFFYRAAFLTGSYTVPEAAKELSREMHQAANTIMSWIELCVTPDIEGWATRSGAYQCYANYCISSGFEPEDTRNFFATLRVQGYNPDKRKRVDSKMERIIVGLQIKE